MPPLSPAPPAGRLRVSGSVLDHVVTVAAGGVHGVLSTESLVGGTALGGAVGGAVGLVQGGPVGAAVGASVGSAAGAAAAHALHRRRRAAALSDVEGGAAPAVHVAVVARYGRDLRALAAEVRAEVEAALREAVGLVPGPVVVEVVDVVDPAAPLARPAP